MGNLKNAALFWCKIKSFMALALAAFFAVFLIRNFMIMSSTKNPDERARAKQGLVAGSIFVGAFILMYYALGTNVGCGLSIAGNVYGLARR